MTINWRFILSKLWKAILIGLFLALGIVLFPQAECAIAQTCNSPRDLWCGSKSCCGSTSGIQFYKNNCSIGRDSKGRPYCDCRNAIGQSPVTCSDRNNCNVTNWHGAPVETTIRNGVTYFNAKKVSLQNDCKLSDHWVQSTCCFGAGDGDGGGCTPEYAPPTIADSYSVYPLNPIPWGQEQPPYGLALGLTLNDVKAYGGTDVVCNTGQQQNITSIAVTLSLSQESINWIVNDLSQRYPGAYIKDSYPKTPERPDVGHPSYACSFAPVNGLNTPVAELDCQFFRPLDPGSYLISVTACQADGQCTTKTLPDPVKVWLLDSSLGK